MCLQKIIELHYSEIIISVFTVFGVVLGWLLTTITKKEN